MSDKDEISLEAAAKDLPIFCQLCDGLVRGKSSVPECVCEQPELSEARSVLDAMLSASRRGKTVTG